MRYRIKYVESCNAYFVMRKIPDGWQGIYSYSHRGWRGRELKFAIRAKRFLTQQSKALNKEGDK